MTDFPQPRDNFITANRPKPPDKCECTGKIGFNRQEKFEEFIFQLEEFVNHSPAARDLRILLVYFQQPKWFTAAYKP